MGVIGFPIKSFAMNYMIFFSMLMNFIDISNFLFVHNKI